MAELMEQVIRKVLFSITASSY